MSTALYPIVEVNMREKEMAFNSFVGTAIDAAFAALAVKSPSLESFWYEAEDEHFKEITASVSLVALGSDLVDTIEQARKEGRKDQEILWRVLQAFAAVRDAQRIELTIKEDASV